MTGKTIHILLVEDEEAHAQLVGRAFESQAGQVNLTVAHSLHEARACLAKSIPDLVISDLLLPDGKGIELLSAGKEDTPYPIVVMTSHGDEQMAVEAMKAGVLDYVVKSDAVLADMPRIAERALREWDLINERKRAEEELKKHRDHLEELVKERTLAYAAVNKELEAFCFSVSHDLRAPLRRIDGFSDILLENHADKLGKEGKNCLNRIISSCDWMNQLIECLLELSRLTQREVRPTKVDLTQLVRQILKELEESQPERKVDITIEEGLTATGDKNLLRVMLVNLLNNAWKFTQKQDQAKIEVGKILYDDTPGFFVRDNGVGFDMDYADKLFKPFQRLHPPDEFPGTGIGLATVQRIINRHGGQIRAESELGKGTAFYFTLPHGNEGKPPTVN